MGQRQSKRSALLSRRHWIKTPRGRPQFPPDVGRRRRARQPPARRRNVKVAGGRADASLRRASGPTRLGRLVVGRRSGLQPPRLRSDLQASPQNVRQQPKQNPPSVIGKVPKPVSKLWPSVAARLPPS